MIDAKTAANNAADYLMQFFPTAKNTQLEEIEIAEADQLWYITLSYEISDGGLNFVRDRKYKIFKVDAERGDVLSMKIREIS